MIVRRLAAGIGALAVGVAAPAIGGEARHGEAAITCTNLASGTSWQIKVDYDKGTVDSNPARISEAEISWRDPTGGNYTLDRKSEKLTVVVASSTGGYSLFHRCRLQN